MLCTCDTFHTVSVLNAAPSLLRTIIIIILFKVYTFCGQGRVSRVSGTSVALGDHQLRAWTRVWAGAYPRLEGCMPGMPGIVLGAVSFSFQPALLRGVAWTVLPCGTAPRPLEGYRSQEQASCLWGGPRRQGAHWSEGSRWVVPGCPHVLGR